MAYTMQSIIDNEDLLSKLIQHLALEDKIKFGKMCNRKFLKFYDFTSDDYGLKDLYDLFGADDGIFDILDDLKYYVDYALILKKYIICNQKMYVESGLVNVHLYADEIADNCTYVDNICKLPLDIFLYKIRYGDRYREYKPFNNVFEEDFDEIFRRSIYLVYVRLLIQTIESYSLDIKYDENSSSFDIKLPTSLSTEIEKYYISVFDEKIDTDRVCTKCGLFGHENISKDCVLYNEQYADIKIKKEVSILLSNMKREVEYMYRAEKRETIRLATKCKSDRCSSSKSSKCILEMCKNCCYRNDACNTCEYHCVLRQKEIQAALDKKIRLQRKKAERLIMSEKRLVLKGS